MSIIVGRDKAGHDVGRLLWVIVVAPVVATVLLILAHGSEDGRKRRNVGKNWLTAELNRAALPRCTRLEAAYGTFQGKSSMIQSGCIIRLYTWLGIQLAFSPGIDIPTNAGWVCKCNKSRGRSLIEVLRVLMSFIKRFDIAAISWSHNY